MPLLLKILLLFLLSFASFGSGLGQTTSTVSQKYIFSQRGLISGASGYGHLSVDVEPNHILDHLTLFRQYVEGFKLIPNQHNSTEFETRKKHIATYLLRHHALLENEFTNVLDSFTLSWEERKKRFIIASAALVGGLVGTALGLFTLPQLLHLSGSVDHPADSEDIIEVLQDHEKRVTILEDKISRINRTLEGFNRNLARERDLEGLDSTAWEMESYLDSLSFEIIRVTAGLDTLFSGRLSPNLINSQALYSALKRLSKKSKSKNFVFPSETILSDIFQLPASYILTEDKKIRIFVHIPLMEQGSVLNLYEHIPLDIPLNDTNGLIARLTGLEGLFAVNRDHTLFSIYEDTSLAGCQQLGHVLFCPATNVLFKDFDAFCVSALFKERSHVIPKVCEYSILHGSAQARQTGPNSFLLFHPKPTKLRINCPGKQTSMQLFSGNKEVHLDEHCRGITDSYEIVSEANFGINLTTQVSLIPLNTTALFHGLEPLHLDALLTSRSGPLRVKDLKREYDLMPHSVATLGIPHFTTWALIIVFAVLSYFAWRRARARLLKHFEPRSETTVNFTANAPSQESPKSTSPFSEARVSLSGAGN